ncbi:hypothetical protein DM02DRAFT_619800 [Periconia macrospinosa]|uniref:Uncharacterized protein n=1 Tax=Periconia macrospinosa TaxID=97972 RepID=A0A2V1D3U2_9PLEO|nr:hypothetical protein DM02DRAFT_619800 [Periconia macrospinosa]
MRSTTLSAAIHPSPKRKRDQPPPPLLPHINTTLRTASTPPRANSPVPDSPRNAVADQLQNMTLTNPSAIPMSPLSPADDIVRKKPKLEDKIRVDSGTSLDEHLAEAKSRAHQDGPKYSEEAIVVNTLPVRRKEIPETPEAQQPRILYDARPTFTLPPTASIQTLSSHQSGTVNRISKVPGRTAQSHRRNKSPSPPLSPLTWQDNEITGHLADPAKDPDDDGTGLNGIGFRPTPAMAYARAQRRRQQVLDWKAREAREARAKRSERRRRGVGGASSREATVEREIRIADKMVTSSPSSRRTVKFAV